MPKFLDVTNKAAARAALGADSVVNVLDHGVTGNGSTNDRAAIQSVVTTYGGVKPIYFPPGRYVLGATGGSGANRITLVAGTHLSFAEGAVIEVRQTDSQSGSSYLYATGTDGTKVDLGATAAKGAQLVVLPTGQGANFAVGDIIGLEARVSIVTYSGDPIWAKEFHRIVSKSGDTVGLDADLEFSYLTADSAQFWKVNTVNNIVIEGAVFECGPGVTAGVNGTYAIRLEKARNFRIDRVQLRRMNGGMVIGDCYGGRIDDCIIDGLPSYGDAYGYGINLTGSTARVTIDNLHGSDTRHVITTLMEQRSGTNWGGPMHIQINNGIGYGSAGSWAIWDTHESGRHIHFNNCQAYGGPVSGFQIRAEDITLNNCSTAYTGSRGVLIFGTAKRCRIIGGDFGFATNQGINVAGSGHQIIGAHVHDTAAGSGIAIPAATDTLIQGCFMQNNSYGVQVGIGTGSDNNIVKDCVLPYSARQLISVLDASATTVLDNLVCLGHAQFGGIRISSPGAWNVVDGVKYSVQTDQGHISNYRPILAATTTETAAGTTTLTIGSAQTQVFTGSTTQTVRLPTTSVPVGHSHTIVNQSSGVVTVNSSGSNLVASLAAGAAGVFLSTTATPTTAAHWLTVNSTGSVASTVQVFTSSGTWTKPAGAVSVRVRCIAGGGGGGAGARGPSGTALSGGGGASAGGMSEMTLDAADLSSTVSVTVGNGGTGGTGQTSDGTAGANGTAGTATTFGAFLTATRGDNGDGGGLAASGAGGASFTGGYGYGMFTGAAGGGGSATGAAGTVGASGTGAAGGGGGGGITTGATANIGGAGGIAFAHSLTGGTAGNGAAGGNGNSPGTDGPGTGGGGGGANTGGAGFNGGNGGAFGAGGGGGGASLNGSTSGAGGNGGAGVCLVVTTF